MAKVKIVGYFHEKGNEKETVAVLPKLGESPTDAIKRVADSHGVDVSAVKATIAELNPAPQDIFVSMGAQSSGRPRPETGPSIAQGLAKHNFFPADRAPSEGATAAQVSSAAQDMGKGATPDSNANPSGEAGRRFL